MYYSMEWILQMEKIMNRDKLEKPWGDGESYNRYIIAELKSFRKDAWKKQLIKNFSRNKDLKILDVGTGPGFFACILKEEGYDVTAIDYSDAMIVCAKNNAKNLGISNSIDFKKMDINNLTFKDEQFDVIISRNVTWTLEYPEKIYADFRRILKKNGIILIYDANWHLHFFDKKMLKRVEKREEQYYEKYGRKEVVAIKNLDFLETAPLTKCERPSWDKTTLEKLEFEVSIDYDITENVYELWEKELYAESPLFEICARKK